MDSTRIESRKNKQKFLQYIINIFNNNSIISEVINDFNLFVEKHPSILTTVDNSGKIIASWVAKENKEDFSRYFVSQYISRNPNALNLLDDKSISPIKYAVIYNNRVFLDELKDNKYLIYKENELLIHAVKNNSVNSVDFLSNITGTFQPDEVIESITIAAEEGFTQIYQLLYRHYHSILQRRKQKFIDGKDFFYCKEKIVKSVEILSLIKEKIVDILSSIKGKIPFSEKSKDDFFMMVLRSGSSFLDPLSTLSYFFVKLGTFVPYISSFKAYNEFKQQNDWISWYTNIREQVDLSSFSPIKSSKNNLEILPISNNKDMIYEFDMEAVLNINDDNQNSGAELDLDPMSAVDEGDTETTTTFYSSYLPSFSGSQQSNIERAFPRRLAEQMSYSNENGRNVYRQPNTPLFNSSNNYMSCPDSITPRRK